MTPKVEDGARTEVSLLAPTGLMYEVGILGTKLSRECKQLCILCCHFGGNFCDSHTQMCLNVLGINTNEITVGCYGGGVVCIPRRDDRTIMCMKCRQFLRISCCIYCFLHLQFIRFFECCISCLHSRLPFLFLDCHQSSELAKLCHLFGHRFDGCI